MSSCLAYPELERQAAGLCILKRRDAIRFTVLLPIKTVSEANRASHEHWRARQKRAKSQSMCAALHLHAAGWASTPVRRAISSGSSIVVLLTRVAPSRGLDSGDNLSGSMKHVRDGIARAMGVDDRSPSVTWLYEQRRGAYGVEAVFAVDAGSKEMGPT